MREHRVIKRRTEWKMLVIPIIIVAALIWFSYSMINIPSAEERYEDMEYYSVVVRSGDTLWSIAEDNIDENNPKDVRKIIYDIQKMNDLGDEFIQPGRLLKVPTYK